MALSALALTSGYAQTTTQVTIAPSQTIQSSGPSTFGAPATQAMGPSLKYGQAFQDYGPRTLPSGPLKPGAQITSQLDKCVDSDDLICEKVEGIAFVESPSEITVSGAPNKKGVTSTVSGMDEAEAKKIADKYLNQSVKMKDLHQVCRDVAAYFQDKNQSLRCACFSSQVLLGHVHQHIECGWILNSKLAQHLAIQQYACALQATNKQTVSVVAHSARRSQAGDPK